MKKTLYCLFLVLCLSVLSYSQTLPKQELRGVWIASLGIDWPKSAGTTASVIQTQKNELTTIFDLHKGYGLNAIYFHVRPKCDAVYKSNYEPWSAYLTGKQGTAPSDPNYDPLTFAVQEAHKRGMELHAWLNPYRILGTGDDPAAVADNNVMKLHPGWVIKCTGTEYRFLDPGLPEVREYLIKVIMDIVRRYDVDGIHFDDYFYPYASYGAFNDDASYNKYKGTFTNKTDWRNNNVNLLLSMINDSIKTVKPWIKFGISPSGNPSVNQEIFCDAFGWLQGKYTDTLGVKHTGTSYIDYIMPQLYWVSYNNQLPAWSGASTLNGRHLYIGLPAYRYADKGFTPNELGWEMRTNRSTGTVSGGVYFSSQSLTEWNYAGCTDSLMHNFYLYPAITPKMAWIPGSTTKPNAPANLRAEKNTVTGKYELKWDAPAKATDGDTAFAYVVYRFETQPTAEMLNDPTKIFGTYGQTTLPPAFAKYSATSGDYYVVTAVDRYSNESAMSNVLHVSMPDQVPGKPVLQIPADNTANLTTTATLSWQSTPLAESYVVQVAKDSLFKTVVAYAPEHRKTSFVYSTVAAGQKYYWRVKAAGAGGTGLYSNPFKFESGIPVNPVLSYPAHQASEIPVKPTLKWIKESKATTYQLQVGTNSLMTTGIVVDTMVTDTAVTLSKTLALNKIHYWRVKAINTLGTSDWSNQWGFKTTATSDVKDEKEQKDQVVREFSLKQNYPNPFNPSTVVKYSTAKDGMVRLSVFDVLGKEVAVLVDRYQNAGSHSVEFNADKFNLTSGIYFYTLKTSDYLATRKMILVK